MAVGVGWVLLGSWVLVRALNALTLETADSFLTRVVVVFFYVDL